MHGFCLCSCSLNSVALHPLEGCHETSQVPLPPKLATAAANDKGRVTSGAPLLGGIFLPGQLPSLSRSEIPRDGKDADKTAAVPLLEDTLCDSRSSSIQSRAFPTKKDQEWVLLVPHQQDPSPPASTTARPQLVVPEHLRSNNASFDAEFHTGESVACSASSITTELNRHPSINRNNVLAVSAHSGNTALPPPGFASTPPEQAAALLLDPPLLLAACRTTRQRYLVKRCSLALPAPSPMVPMNPPSPPPPPVTITLLPTEGPPSLLPAPLPCAAADKGRAVTAESSCPQPLSSQPTNSAPPSAASSGGRETQLPSPHIDFARQRLQRELLLAAELPVCPLMLRPHRVYVEPHAVHVVYDSTGDFTDLYNYLHAHHGRLTEAACRGVMRQLLQAVAALHSEGWVHRNISTETVWVVEEPQAPASPPHTHPGEHPPPAPQQFQASHHHRDQDAVPERRSSTCSRNAGGSSSRTGSSDSGAAVASGVSETGAVCAPERCVTRLRVKLGGLELAGRLPVGDTAAAVAAAAAAGGVQEGKVLVGGPLLGCAYHLAPETIRGAGCGQSADIWAAGVLLFMLLTGRPPFPGVNELEVMTRILMASTAAGVTAGAAGGGRALPSPTQEEDEEEGEPLAPRLPLGSAPSGGDSACRELHVQWEDGAQNRAESRTRVVVWGAADRELRTPGCRAGDGSGVDGRVEEDAGRGAEGIVGGAAQCRTEVESVEEVVVQGVLESGASAACLEVLAGMLTSDPAQRMGASDLLQLPWFGVEK